MKEKEEDEKTGGSYSSWRGGGGESGVEKWREARTHTHTHRLTPYIHKNLFSTLKQKLF